MYQNKKICVYFILLNAESLPRGTLTLQSSSVQHIALLFPAYGLGKFSLLVVLAVSRLLGSRPLEHFSLVPKIALYVHCIRGGHVTL